MGRGTSGPTRRTRRARARARAGTGARPDAPAPARLGSGRSGQASDLEEDALFISFGMPHWVMSRRRYLQMGRAGRRWTLLALALWVSFWALVTTALALCLVALFIPGFGTLSWGGRVVLALVCLFCGGIAVWVMRTDTAYWPWLWGHRDSPRLPRDATGSAQG